MRWQERAGSSNGTATRQGLDAWAGFVLSARRSRDQRIDILFISYSDQGEEGIAAR